MAMVTGDEHGEQPVVPFSDRATAVAAVQRLDVEAMHDKVTAILASITRDTCPGSGPQPHWMFRMLRYK